MNCGNLQTVCCIGERFLGELRQLTKGNNWKKTLQVQELLPQTTHFFLTLDKIKIMLTS